jgi:integrase
MLSPVRRHRGEGSIFKVEGSRNWYIQVGAKSPRVSTGTSHKQKALAKLQELIARRNSGAPTLYCGLKYEEARNSFLAEYRNAKKRSLYTRKNGTETIWGLDHLNNFFVGRRISSITTDTLREFAARRLKAGASSSTVNRNLGLLRRMLHQARKEGRLQVVPHFPMLKEAEPRQGFLEPEQFTKLMAALPERLRTFVLLLYTSGVRTGEAKKIQWEHVDLKHKIIKLPGSITKNGKPRTLPLVAEVCSRLEKVNRKRGCVFPVGNFIKAWWSACAKTGLGTRTKGKQNGRYGTYSGLIPHDLRRSAVRNMVRAGISTTVARSVSGHVTDAIFDRYDITSAEDLKKAAATLDERYCASYCTVESLTLPEKSVKS